MFQTSLQQLSQLALAVAICTPVFASAQGQAAGPAQAYPSRPVRIVVPFPPGGNSDQLTRLIAPRLAETWGQQVLVDNRGGAGGIIGMEFGKKAPPDGYTVICASAGIMAINPFLYAKLPYDPQRDFAPVSMGAYFPHIVSVHPSVSATSVKELIQLAKDRPGQIAYSSAGVGTPNHLAAELFKTMTRVDMIHVAHKGAANAMLDLLGGHVSLMFSPAALALPHGRTGKLRLLAVTTSKRLDYLRDLPTLAESGLPGYEAIAWNGFVVPAGTSRDIVAKLNTEIVRILALPDVKAQLAAGGDVPWATTPEQFAQIIQSEMTKWSKVVRDSGARAD